MMTRVALALVIVGFLGCCFAQEKKETVSVQFRLGETEPGPGLKEMSVPGSDRKVYLHDRVELSNEDIASASVRMNENGPVKGPIIEMTFTEVGGEMLRRVTRENIGKILAIVVDGKVLSAPVITSEIGGGKGVITGTFTMDEAKRIADGLCGK